MTFFEKLQSQLTNLDQKTWYQYLAAAAVVFFLLVGLIIFFYFSTISKWEQKIDDLNETRQEVKRLLDKAKRVQKERAEITALLEEEPNFKIKAYMQEVLEKIGIFGNVTRGDVTKISHEDNYVENVAIYQLSNITMRQLTELLSEIDENKRVFTKELDITKSKKVPNTIDVEIQVATMIPKETAQ